jgi:serine O-acetyltransferase
MSLTLAVGTERELAGVTALQLGAMFPDPDARHDAERIEALLPATLARLRPILSSARSFKTDHFNHRHSMQYATYLYLLGNESWLQGTSTELSDRLFCLNRALHGLDLFYQLALPEIFLISHGVGLVLGATVYGERLMLSQNVTVGRVGEARPIIGSNIVFYPGAVVTGNSVIGDGCVVAANTVLHNCNVPANTIAKMGIDGPVFIPRTRDLIGLYFD